MYICNRCSKGFVQPYVAGVDAGTLHDVGVVRKHKAPMISLCPHCGTGDIRKEDLAKVG